MQTVQIGTLCTWSAIVHKRQVSLPIKKRSHRTCLVTSSCDWFWKLMRTVCGV